MFNIACNCEHYDLKKNMDKHLKRVSFDLIEASKSNFRMVITNQSCLTLHATVSTMS